MEAIIAISNNGIIGEGSGLPWHCTEDLQHFKQYTYGMTIIAGTNTIVGLPKLPKRTLIQLGSGSKLPNADDICHTPESTFCKYPTGIVIGGAKTIQAMLLYVNKLVVTHLDIFVEPKANSVYFDIPAGWVENKAYELSDIAVVREYVKC